MAKADPLKLDALQRDVLLPQIEAFINAVNDPGSRESYRALKDAVVRMEVPPEHSERLGSIIELALTSGRIRKLFGPGAEVSLSSLFQQTSHGREVAEAIASVNRALLELKGQQVEQIRVSQPRPGSYAMTVGTDRCQLVIRFEPTGIRI